MHLKDFRGQFDKRAERVALEFEIRPGATEDQIRAAEERLGVSFHEQIAGFYSCCNGFVVYAPHFEVHQLEELEYIDLFLIHFATADHCHKLCFDTSSKNEAGQWFIVDPDTGFRVTHTMASLWSNKIWKWIDQGRMIWNKDWKEEL